MLVTRIVFWLAQPNAAEDAYITFRYARSFAGGYGLAFNPGERVMGFTSPPWTLWSALGIFLRIDPVLWTRATSVGADVMILTLGVRMLLAAAGAASAWAFAAFFSLWPLFAASSVSGMESTAFLAAIVLAAWLASRRSGWSGPALALVALFRPEGIPAALVLALGANARARWIALGLTGAGVLALASYFGSPVPQSLIAKATLYGTPGPWAGRYWWEWLLPFPLGRFTDIAEGVQMLPIAAVFAAALACGSVELWRERSNAAARAAAAAIGIWLGYALLGVAFFWWYLVVPLGGLAMVAAAGFPRVVAGRWVPVMGVLFLFGSWTVAPSLYLGRAEAESRSFGAVSEFLLRCAAPGEAVMLEPIGLIGYRNSLRVIDEMGLVSPEVARRRLRGSGWYSDLVAERHPEWLVLRHDVVATGEAFAGAGGPFRSVAERDSMLARYHLELPSHPERGNPFEVYRRVR